VLDSEEGLGFCVRCDGCRLEALLRGMLELYLGGALLHRLSIELFIRSFSR
jgi:hypothetical protein